ncbi:MAG: hypothetical protein Q7U04_09970 [Bacteriovorax sp.]|nr:hypothetical protein [Bacteriovorax sp.]
MEPFKNLFNSKSSEKIALAILRSYPKFDSKSFLKGIGPMLEPLELKERVNFLTRRLYEFLPTDPKKSIPILLKATKQNEKDTVGISQFTLWPLTHFISIYGLEDFDLSMNALKQMTKLFTSEFAVRAFFERDQALTLKFFKLWLKDENEHVRRLVSEGSRPLLPWGQKLHGFVMDPELTWVFLEKLKNDPSEYVRKSVANHINDHSKNHPEYVIEKLLTWHHSKKKTHELDWVIKHASRTLIKKGYKKAFLLHGVAASNIELLEQKILTKKIILGESLKVKITLKNHSKEPAYIILDHELHLLKSNNKHGLKVFKGKKITLEVAQVMTIEMSIPLKSVTTRVYYSGEQFWNIKINGSTQVALPFILKLT